MASSFNLAAPIGIFDSGIGGISIARCIEQELPNEQLVYFADSHYAPYGDKPVAEIVERVNTVADKLLAQGVKAIVVACNTATVNAIEQLRSRVDVPVIGVEPAIKPAATISQNQRIGMMVTRATASNQRFLALVEQYKADSQVIIQPCPGLVQLIEQGHANSSKCDNLLKQYIAPLIDAEIDTLVLGCTHYPLLADKIQTITGDSITLLETALPVTNELKRRLAEQQLLAYKPKNKPHLVISSGASSKHERKQVLEIIQQFWPTSFSSQ